jgi:hypothetical protein
VGRDAVGAAGEGVTMSEQPAPVPNDLPAVWDLVIEDMRRRDALGLSRYGTRLQPHNGRDALRDAYEEALDMVAYLRQEIEEREDLRAEVKRLKEEIERVKGGN